MASVWLIQVLYFPEHRSEEPVSVEDRLVERVRHMFAGVILKRDSAHSPYTGCVNSGDDDADLTNIHWNNTESEESLGFQIHSRTRGRIDYQFHRENGKWVGSYDGSHVGKGTARCILQQGSADILLPPPHHPSTDNLQVVYYPGQEISTEMNLPAAR